MSIPLPRCYDHKNAASLPALCHTCQRINVEHDIVTRTVEAFLARAYTIRESEDGKYTDSKDETLAILFDLDDAFLVVSKDGKKDNGWIRFVFGNDGYDVISDYTTNLESILAPINEYADTFSV